MNKTINTPRAPMSRVSIGGYGNSLLVPANKLGALIDILAQCRIVTNEWAGDSQYVTVYANDKVEVDLTVDQPLTRDEFNSLRDAIRAEKEAQEVAEAAAEVAAEAAANQ